MIGDLSNGVPVFWRLVICSLNGGRTFNVGMNGSESIGARPPAVVFSPKRKVRAGTKCHKQS